MSQVRVCFLGTPEFAVTHLQAMLNDEHFKVVGVVTQPDRPSGRKLQLTPSPVKSLAQSRGIKVISPESVNQTLILQEIESWGAEVAVVVAFGQILSQKFLDLFPFGAVNVHGSILPRWRGAAPIQRSLEAGETETGVTLQKVVKKLDAGDVLGLRRLKVTDEMNAQDVHDQLARLGADLLHIELMDFVRGNLAGEPQDESLVTYAKKIEKSEAELHWEQSAESLHNKVRAFIYGPGTWILFRGKKLKIHRTKVYPSSAEMRVAVGDAVPGKVLLCENDRLVIACRSGALELLEVQPESRNRMSVADFLKSNPLRVGDLFG